MSIANKIRSLRLKKRMTMKEIAGRIGVPSSTYRDWEYGRKISAEKLQKLADAFEISVSELMTGEKDDRKDLKRAIQLIEEVLHILRKI